MLPDHPAHCSIIQQNIPPPRTLPDHLANHRLNWHISQSPSMLQCHPSQKHQHIVSLWSTTYRHPAHHSIAQSSIQHMVASTRALCQLAHCSLTRRDISSLSTSLHHLAHWQITQNIIAPPGTLPIHPERHSITRHNIPSHRTEDHHPAQCTVTQNIVSAHCSPSNEFGYSRGLVKP